MNNSQNYVKLEMDARSENVALARVLVSTFIAPFDPTMGELSDIKTAVSEAVTNAVIHGYGEAAGIVTMIVTSETVPNGKKIIIKISDSGVGIENIENAREPLFTTKPEMERSGLGFTVMESFMDSVEITSSPGSGTTVSLTKTLQMQEQ